MLCIAMDKPASKHPRNSATRCPALSPDKPCFAVLQVGGRLISPAGAGSARAPTSITESFPGPGPGAADPGGCIFQIYFPLRTSTTRAVLCPPERLGAHLVSAGTHHCNFLLKITDLQALSKTGPPPEQPSKFFFC